MGLQSLLLFGAMAMNSSDPLWAASWHWIRGGNRNERRKS
jgi:hypothetical protein